MIIPVWLYRLIVLISVLMLIGIVVYLRDQDARVYTRTYDLLGEIEGVEKSELAHTFIAGLIIFVPLFIPWCVVMAILRQFSAMPPLKNEFIQLRRENRAKIEIKPVDARIAGGVIMGFGIFLIGVNIAIWQMLEDIFLELVVAVPVMIIMGAYSVVTGKIPGRS